MQSLWDYLTLMQIQQLTARLALENLPNPARRKQLAKKKLGLG